MVNEEGAGPGSRTKSTGGSRPAASGPVFWKEIYWFTVVSLAGWMLALFVLAPRLARRRTAHDMEAGLCSTTIRLARFEREYEAAIQAVEDDPFYREELIRAVLKVKKSNEEFLKDAAALSDN